MRFKCANRISIFLRSFRHARSSNPQFRREYDDILDGLRKAGVREQ